MSNDSVRQYDIKHAVHAEVYVGATYTTRDVHEKVFGVCQKRLEELAGSHPTELTCWHNLTTRSDEGRLWVDAYVVDHLKRVIHLGEILTSGLAQKRWEECVQNCEEDGELEALRKLRDEGPHQIIRDRFHGCTIGVQADTVSNETVEQGVRKFLRTFCPSLAELPIQWLPEETVINLDKRIADFKEAMEQCERALYDAMPDMDNKAERLFIDIVEAEKREQDLSQ